MGLSLKGIVKGIAKAADVVLDVATAPVSAVTSIFPGKLGDVAKTGLGILTANPTLVLSGVAGFVSSAAEGAKGGPKTEVPQSPVLATRSHAPQSPSGARYDSSSKLDSSFAGYVDALKTLEQNWSTFDTVVGKKDGKFSRENLQAILNSAHASPELKRAARFLLEHPEYFNRLETAGKSTGVFDLNQHPNDIVRKSDLDVELATARAELQRYGVRPPPGEGSSGCSTRGAAATRNDADKWGVKLPANSPHASSGASSCGSLKDVVSKGQGSVDERALAVMGDMMTKLDAEFDSLVSQMERGEGDSQALQFKLQQVMEKRSRMFNLMSTVSSKLNEMWNHSIQNMGKA